MKNINQKITLSIYLFVLGLFFVIPTIVSAETIRSFDVGIRVNTDNSIDVSETIVYDSEGIEKHGIFRTVRLTSSQERTMDLQSVVVTDEDGNPYPVETSHTGDSVTFKIGDPATTFRGQKTYIISYRATQAVAHLEQIDEIYWNATGSDWLVPIKTMNVRVELPDGASPVQQACYIGVAGSTERCLEQKDSFVLQRPLLKGEGLTIAVGFQKGFVDPYIPQTFFQKYKMALVALVGTLLFVGWLFFRWRKYGRDPKGAGVIIPQYDVPGSLTPMEVGVIMYQKVRTNDISAELIYLATKGYIKIRQTEKKVLGLFRSSEYELILIKNDWNALIEADKKLLSSLFSKQEIGQTISLSELENKFYKKIPSITGSIRTGVLTKGYYAYLPGILSPVPILFLFFAVFLVSSISIDSPSFVFSVLAVVVSIVAFIIFQRLMPAKTEKGVALQEHLLGLKEYMRVAEKDRLAFHNAPEKKPELFENLLPFALVLGIEESWAREFDGLYTTPPAWYERENRDAFSAMALTHSLNAFSSVAFASLTHSPRSSGGSGGGGSSGGGGGGGGGGSW